MLSTGTGCDKKNIMTKFDHRYVNHEVGIRRPNHWKSSPSKDQSGVESIVLKLACKM